MTKVRQALDFATPSQDIIDKLLKGRALPSVADQAPGTWALQSEHRAAAVRPGAGQGTAGRGGSDARRRRRPGRSGPDRRSTTSLDGEVKPLEIELWFISGDTQSERIMPGHRAELEQHRRQDDRLNQDVSTIWGPEGYQFTETMTGCLYSWFNGNDPDDMFYWHSDADSGRARRGPAATSSAYFHEYNFQEEIDELDRAGDATTDQEARKEIYWQIQELLHEEVPVIFIYWGKAFPAVAQQHRRLLAERVQPHAVERQRVVLGLDRLSGCVNRLRARAGLAGECRRRVLAHLLTLEGLLTRRVYSAPLRHTPRAGGDSAPARRRGALVHLHAARAGRAGRAVRPQRADVGRSSCKPSATTWVSTGPCHEQLLDLACESLPGRSRRLLHPVPAGLAGDRDVFPTPSSSWARD